MSLSSHSISFHVKPATLRLLKFQTPAVSASHSSGGSNPYNASPSLPTARSPTATPLTGRRAAMATAPLLLAAAAMALSHVPLAAVAGEEGGAMAWGTHSFIKEKYFLPSLSPEDAAARIRQTAEGMRDLRHMLDATAWRYVLFYVRQKSAYLSSDLQNALAVLPTSDKARRKAYVGAANELVDNIAQVFYLKFNESRNCMPLMKECITDEGCKLDRYVRTPKVYESHVYYEKTLKSLDDVVLLLGA